MQAIPAVDEWIEQPDAWRRDRNETLRARGMTRRSWPRGRGSARAAAGEREVTSAFEVAQLDAPFRFHDCRRRFASWFT